MSNLEVPEVYKQFSKNKDWTILLLGRTGFQIFSSSLDSAKLQTQLQILDGNLSWNSLDQESVLFIFEQGEVESGQPQKQKISISSQSKKTTVVCFHDPEASFYNELNVISGSQVEWIDIYNKSGQTPRKVVNQIQIQKDSTLKKWIFESNFGSKSEISETIGLMDQGSRIESQWLISSRLNSTQSHSLYFDHVAPNSSSQIECRALADSTSKTMFKGTVRIPKDSQKVQSAMLLKSLLLEKGAQVQIQPELLIDANDVKAAHGATVGFLNQEELFYLESRGLSKEHAKKLLMQGFFSEALRDVDLPTRIAMQFTLETTLKADSSQAYSC